jgi:Uma2 family endonuclease
LPPAKKRQNKIAERIFLRLLSAVTEAQAKGEAQELGEACMEMGYRLSSDAWVQPDVSVTHAGQPEAEYIEGAPAIAVEIISPGNSADEIAAKTALYFEFGAIEVWRVYPKLRQVEIYTAAGAHFIKADDSVTTPLLPAFAMPVKEVLGE